MFRLICFSLLLTLFATSCGANPTPTSTSTPTRTPTASPSPATQIPNFTPTPLPPSLPEYLMGDSNYAAVIRNHQWSYNDEQNQIWVNWSNSGKQEDYELAFEKNSSGEWEVRKFVLEREPVDISNLTCNVIRTHTPGSCIQEWPSHPSEFDIKFIPGDLTLETIPTSYGNLQIIWADALTKREEEEEERIKIALQVDMGDGMDAASFKGQKSAVSIFEIADLFPTNGSFTFTFPKSLEGLTANRIYKNLVLASVEIYRAFFLGEAVPADFIFLPGAKQSGNSY